MFTATLGGNLKNRQPQAKLVDRLSLPFSSELFYSPQHRIFTIAPGHLIYFYIRTNRYSKSIPDGKYTKNKLTY